MSQKVVSNFSQEYEIVYLDSEQSISFIVFKRLLDIILSIVILIITLPFVLLIMILIKIESKGPALFYQERVGKDGKLYKIIKLRSMYSNAERYGPRWASINDHRITRMGKLIRFFRVDELPQLINVIKNEMSLIGPRPEQPIFVFKFNNEINGFSNRLSVKPGITGWAQVNGGYELSPEEKLTFDLYYIKYKSIRFEIKIILKTIIVVFTGNGAR